MGPPLHSHDYVEFHIIEEGAMRCVTDTEDFVAEEGDIVVISPGTLHRVETVGPGRTTDLAVHLNDKFEWELAKL